LAKFYFPLKIKQHNVQLSDETVASKTEREPKESVRWHCNNYDDRGEYPGMTNISCLVHARLTQSYVWLGIARHVYRGIVMVLEYWNIHQRDLTMHTHWFMAAQSQGLAAILD
jgi:hypothetical protein